MALRGFAEYSEIQATLLGQDDPVRVVAGVIIGNYFELMGLGAVTGRVFSTRDDGPAAAPVMVLTQSYWLQHFGGEREAVGRTVRVNGMPVVIVGVVQDAPKYPGQTDVFVNMVVSPHHISATMVTGRTHRMTEVFARLAPGATLPSARAEIARLASKVYGEYPEVYEKAAGYAVSVTPLRDIMNERATLTFWLLMGAAAFVFLISCANVANLTLIRGIQRERELIVRRAMGAGAIQLRRLLLAENVLLALVGGALGLVIAAAGLGLLVAFAKQLTTRGGEIRLDAPVLVFTLLVAIAAAAVLAFVPNVGAEGSLAASLASVGKRTTSGRGRQRLQRSLVVVQVAVSVVLLTGAGLLVRTLQKLQVVDAGVGVENVLTMEVPMDGTGRNAVQQLDLYERMRGQLAALPGVSEVGLSSNVPLRALEFKLDVKADGRPVPAGMPTPNAEYRTASPEFFRAAAIPVIRGREFASTDRQGSPLVVIINQTLAKRVFGGTDPVGQRIAWTGDVLRFVPISGDWRTVVGVVGDTHDSGLDEAPEPALYQPFAQTQEMFAGAFVMRTRSDPATLAASAVRTIRALDPQALIERVQTLEQVRDDGVAPRRVNALLVTSFGGLALVIAAVGIAGALAASRALATLLFGVTPSDPLTIGGVAMVMAGVGTLACWIPAARAARVQPAIAFRAE